MITTLATSLVCAPQPTTVVGHSLSPLVATNQIVKIFPTHCRQPVVGDLVVLNTKKVKIPIIKVIAGIPGDIMLVQQDGKLSINGSYIQNPRGDAYILPKNRVALLKLFEGRLRGFLIIGNPHSIDSSVLGVIAPSRILGVSPAP